MSIKKIGLILIFVICLSLLSFISIKANKLPLMGKIIYIDPGHGGVDPGSIYKDIYEKDINLKICLKLQSFLEKEGATVYLTRDGDYDLSSPKALYRKKSDLNNRVKIINSSKADLYISIHLNSTNSKTWYGAQVFFDDVNKENKKIAEIMQKHLQADLDTDRQVEEISTMLLNRKVIIPGVLIEVGFLSNGNERYLLRKEDYQNKISKSITKGVIEYFNK